MTATMLEFDAMQTAARLGAAVLFGGVIGLNRDIHGKPAEIGRAHV